MDSILNKFGNTMNGRMMFPEAILAVEEYIV